MNKLSFIIPAAGKSELGESLLEISNNEFLLFRQIRLIRQESDAPITVVVGYKSEKVINALSTWHNLRFVENELFEHTNVARSIYLGMLASPSHRTSIIYGDLVFNENLISGLMDQNELGSCLFVDRGRYRQEEVGCNIHEDGTILNLEYGLKKKWGHIASFNLSERKLFLSIAGKKENRRLFGHEVINKMIDNGANIVEFSQKKTKLVEIDTEKDLFLARKIFK